MIYCNAQFSEIFQKTVFYDFVNDIDARAAIRRKLVSLFTYDNCGALRDLVQFVQFKKREKHPWRSVNFSKVAGCLQLY